jgi:hypothetical protein
VSRRGPSQTELDELRRTLKPGEQRRISEGVYVRRDGSGRLRFQTRHRLAGANPHSPARTFDAWEEADRDYRRPRFEKEHLHNFAWRVSSRCRLAGAADRVGRVTVSDHLPGVGAASRGERPGTGRAGPSSLRQRHLPRATPPLATIDGLADGVVSSSPETWQVLRTQTLRMRRLVDDLATLTRAEEGRIDLQRAHLQLEEVLREAAEAARVTFVEKQIDLVVEDANEPVSVDADPVRLGEVLANLLENAARHTPSGGRVALAASRAGDRARIIVTDTGEGIPPDQLDHVFDRFHRVDTSRSRETGGGGLGLAISRALIHAHHGTITAESGVPGRGSRFVTDLPRDG